MPKMHHLLSIGTDKAMTPNARLSIKMLGSALALVLIGWIAVPAAIAQPTSPSPETQPPAAQPPQQTQPPPANPEPQQNSYVGFGGVIGLQGGTTSLSQGTFAILSKHVLTNNLAIHSDTTIFGSLTSSNSIALTFNKPMSSDSLPLVFTPFLGAGIIAYNENGTKISPLITGGIDIYTPTNITLTVRANAGLVSDRKADIGVLFGVGFNY
jgi:hypothetical protein